MFGNGKLAARSTLAAGLAGLVMLTAAPALAAAPAATTARPGPAAGTPAATGSFKTWPAAQRAAGFRLKAAKRTYGLKRRHPILVGKCEVTGKLSKRDVYAEWDGTRNASKRYMSVDQNNSGGACSNFGAARPLGTYRIRGHKAHMFGFCGGMGLPSCRTRNIVLVLAWKAGRNYYVTYSNNEWRSTLAGFSRSLRRV
jgi:hypothetical protein